MRRVFAFTIISSAVVILAACDPGYVIGARLSLARTTKDSCLIAATRRLMREGDSTAINRRRGSYFRVELAKPPSVVPDSAPWIWNNAMIKIGPAADSTLPVRLTTEWIGVAQIIPLPEQRLFIDAATSELERVRSTCAPASSAHVQCFAHGFGGRPACGDST